MMNLKIIAPEGTQTHEVLWLELNTRVGNFVVQPGHTPMIVSLAQNKDITFCLTNGKQETLAPMAGIAEITRNSATILLTQITD